MMSRVLTQVNLRAFGHKYLIVEYKMRVSLNMCSIPKLLILGELSFIHQIGLMKDGRLLTFITELVKQHT